MLRDSASAAPGPYERLLADALRGDSTLFIRFDETEEAWQLLDPLLAGWDSLPDAGLQPYAAGSGGPDISGLYRHHPVWQQAAQRSGGSA
jgi:glucose-6-phosphate 1-dehydrogenase